MQHPRREGGDLGGIRDVALDGVELRVLHLHLVQHRLASTSHDDFVAEFDELERESKADASRAPGDEDGTTAEIHRGPVKTTVRGKCASLKGGPQTSLPPSSSSAV